MLALHVLMFTLSIAFTVFIFFVVCPQKSSDYVVSWLCIFWLNISNTSSMHFRVRFVFLLHSLFTWSDCCLFPGAPLWGRIGPWPAMVCLLWPYGLCIPISFTMNASSPLPLLYISPVHYCLHAVTHFFHKIVLWYLL